MNTEQLQKEYEDAERTAPMASERCQCGYPMPCAQTVPITFCRAKLPDNATSQKATA